MGFFNKITSLYNRVIQSMQDVRDVTFNLPAKIEENSQVFSTIFNTNWSDRTMKEREEAVEQIKHRVIHDLIPAAGQLNLFGAPGLMVYTPCQIVGALAIAYIYDSEYTVTPKYMLNVAKVMIYGGLAGELVWTEFLKILASILTPPMIGIAMISYVQAWTEIALNTVHNYYRTEFLKKQKVKTKDTTQAFKIAISKPTNSKPKVTTNIQDSEVIKEANKLLHRINQGGKVLFPAQEQVFHELVQGVNSESALTLGRTHIFRGVAGSGKTVILGQLVPHLAETFRVRHGYYPSILVYHHNNYINQLLADEIKSAVDAPINIQPLPKSFYENHVCIHSLSTLKDDLYQRKMMNKGLSLKGIMESNERAKKIFDYLDNYTGIFDIVFVDEGQDISQEEYNLIINLCRSGSTTKSKSIYIFCDDLQNIFGIKDLVLKRVNSQRPIEHFLSTCVRTSKKLVDFTFNTCLGDSLDDISRVELERLMNLNKLKERSLIAENYIENGRNWFSCNFCVFPGETTPEVRQFSSNKECCNAIVEDLDKLLSEQGLERVLEGGVLIQCFSKNMVKEISNLLYTKFGNRVKRRSGEDIGNEVKRMKLVVEPQTINVSLVWDAKGYDANIVYVINPDGGNENTIKKRSLFYVAATRAKQFLAVYSSIPERNAPIMQDALIAVQKLEQQLVETQK
jgi:hypothetical protein